MKAHLTKVSLALLSAVFLLGCQEQGSGPVGPGPEFDRPFSHSCTMPVDGHCHDGETVDATYTATFEGDIIGIDIKLVEGLNTFDALLDLSSFQAAPSDGGYTADDGAICFEEGTFSVLFSIREGKKNDPWEAVAGPLSFKALGTDGTPVNYGLNLFGTINDGKLPPDLGGPSLKITWETFAIFNQGGGKHVACIGTGFLKSDVEVTATPTPQ